MIALGIVCLTIVLIELIGWGMYVSLQKCKHEYDPPENGSQKCKHCGIIQCNHSWEIIDSSTSGPVMVNILQCKNCGDIKYKTFNALKGE